jgi:regulator of protease activity HflC (stomatin/prohibitin superfamily)
MGNPYTAAAAVAAIALATVLLLSSIRVANEYQRAVVFRLGRLCRARGPGLYFLIPLIERQIVIDLRVVTADVEEQEAITKDNVPVKVDAVVWYRAVDPAKSVVEVQNVHEAVTQVALTLLRNLLGKHSLDDLLKEKDKLSEELRANIDRATGPWGIEVQMVEMKDVVIPQSMQRAMAQEAEALREKRARIIKAEAELEAAAQLKAAAMLIMEARPGSSCAACR